MFVATSIATARNHQLLSPDGALRVEVTVDGELFYSVSHKGRTILAPSKVALRLADGTTLGEQCHVQRVRRTSVDEVVKPHFYGKNTIRDHYNALTLEMRGRYSVEFRAYDEGVAYRFATSRKEPYMVTEEVAEFNFDAPHKAWVGYNNLTGNKGERNDRFFTSFESLYDYVSLPEMQHDRLAYGPLVVNVDGVKVCLAESDVENYPGMFYQNPDKSNSVRGICAPAPKRVEEGGYRKLQGIIRERYPYVAVCEGTRTLPWRIVAVAENDTELVDNDMVYLLASPSRVADTSWIRPGKVAWEWWNHWGLRGVDFEAGINTETYKEYVNFAAENGIEYVILDEGWATIGKNDLFDIVPEIDMKHLVEYAASKGVGIILWAGYNAFNKDIERVCSHYAAMGVKGFKIDFMDRDDVDMMKFYYRAAEVAARHKLIVDFHGCAKPSGLNRTYPNVLNFEAVFGLETMKFRGAEKRDMMRHDVLIPFIRMVAGPMDYTQGAMRNANKKNFRAISHEPMSQGTRVHQMALYAIYLSPLSMLCDSPSNYRDEQECTDFIAAFPTVWDETVVLDGEMGEYVAVARRAGDVWYVGAVTSWTPRTLTLDLRQIIGEGNYRVELFRDGANAHRLGTDYRREVIDMPASRRIEAKMAPGGGFVMKITKQ